tara:strand:- start:1310 stop:1507 length:198 start_codon:yes stop_codon:yes gene_type:complete
MSDTFLEEVYINLSKREVTIISDEGEVKKVSWKWDDEGSEGFAETVDMITKVVPDDQITYTFATV